MTRFSAILLSVLLLAGTVLADDLQTEAQRAVAERKYVEARDLYRQLHERYPDTVEYLLWIGRLSGWMQEYDVALSSFDRLLAREPLHSEALLGKAYVLMWQREFAAALPLIRQAEELRPADPEVHLALARYHYYQGNTEGTRSALRSTLGVDPGNREALELQERVRTPSRAIVVFGYEGSHFSFSEPGHTGSVEASLRRDNTHVLLRYEESELFGDRAHRAGLEVSRRTGEKLWVRAGAAVAPGATALPVQAYNVGASLGMSGGLALGMDYRFYDFRDATVHMLSPGLEYYFKKPMWIETRLYSSRVRQRATTGAEHTFSFQTRYHQRLSRKVNADFGYARGRETFTVLSADRIASFDANTFIGGADIKVSETWGLRFYSLLQRRDDGESRNTFGLSFVLER